MKKVVLGVRTRNMRILSCMLLSVFACLATGGLVPTATLLNGSLSGATGTKIVPMGWEMAYVAPDTVEPNFLRWGVGYYGFSSPNSPDGGTFVNAREDTRGTEAFKQQVTGLLPNTSYVISFYQSNSGFSDLYGKPIQTEPGHWEITFAGSIQNSPTMRFEGNGNQTWALINMTFATSPIMNSAFLTFRARRDSTSGDIPTRISIDGISIVQGP